MQFVDGRPCFPFKPNWKSAVQETFRYKTDIFTSNDGTEDRSSAREFPSEQFSASFDGRGKTVRAIRNLLVKHGSTDMVFPDFVRGYKIVEQGENYIVLDVDEYPEWAKFNRQICLESDVGLHFRTITSLADGFLRYDGDDVIGVLSAREGFRGYSESSFSFTTETSNVSTFSLKIEKDADSFHRRKSQTQLEYRGIPVFPFVPNWSRPLSETVSREMINLDYGYGPVSRYTPWDEASWSGEMTCLSRSREQTEALLSFYDDMKGRRGSFYSPAWFNSVEVLSKGVKTILVEGDEFHELVDSSERFRNLAVKTDSEVILTEIISTTKIDGNTELQLDVDLSGVKVRNVQWLLLSRFSSDTVVVEWQTDSVAQFKIGITSLYDVFGELSINDHRLSFGGNYVTFNEEEEPYRFPLAVAGNSFLISEQEVV